MSLARQLTQAAMTQAAMTQAAIAAALLTTCLLVSHPIHAAEGALVVSGSYVSGVGETSSRGLPESAKEWPTDQWYALHLTSGNMRVEAIGIGKKNEKPEFITRIIRSQVSAQDTQTELEATYVRVPGLQLKTGPVTHYQFKNGTASMRPKLSYTYELELAGNPFSFSFQNGLRNRRGVPYGGGAQFRVSYAGQTYDYDLGGFGWDNAIQALGDFDGDGRPDFLIYVGGNNSSATHLLLSSKAKIGVNVPTATVSSMGC
jgi:hypothetical protein